jgi:hypothetical protein
VKLPPLRYVALVAASVGATVAILVIALQFAGIEVPDVALFFWPTWSLLMITDGHEQEWWSYLIFAASILANAVVYVIVFTLVWCVAWMLAAWKASLRDGTTI